MSWRDAAVNCYKCYHFAKICKKTERDKYTQRFKEQAREGLEEELNAHDLFTPFIPKMHSIYDAVDECKNCNYKSPKIAERAPGWRIEKVEEIAEEEIFSTAAPSVPRVEIAFKEAGTGKIARMPKMKL